MMHKQQTVRESLTMNINDYADGIYDITAYLYTNADLDLAEIAFPLVDVPEFMIPITVDYMRSELSKVYILKKL